MKKILLLTLAGVLAIATGLTAGCSSEAPEKAVTEAQTEITQLGDAARKADGDFNKLSETDKQKFLTRTNGNQAAAEQMVSRMSGKAGARGPGQ